MIAIKRTCLCVRVCVYVCVLRLTMYVGGGHSYVIVGSCQCPRECVFFDNWSSQEHSSAFLTRSASNIAHKIFAGKKIRHLLYYYIKAVAQSSILYFHQVSKITLQPHNNRYISSYANPTAVVKPFKQLDVSEKTPLAERRRGVNQEFSPHSGHLQSPYCLCGDPHTCQ